jgi:sigma-B regulation protein RsbU (phosphoserine phosphatase)
MVPGRPGRHSRGGLDDLLAAARRFRHRPVLVFVFVTGNVTVFGLGLAGPLFDQPFPRNWIVYLALLLPIGAAGSLAASLILYWLHPPVDQDTGRWFVSNVSFATLIAFLTGISTYAVQSTRSRLEAEKEQLRREVFKGLKRVRDQESQLQAAFEIQANLLPKTIPQIPGVQISCAWQPAQVVSGDYFDVIALSGKKIGVCLADVAGKGIGRGHAHGQSPGRLPCLCGGYQRARRALRQA